MNQEQQEQLKIVEAWIRMGNYHAADRLLRCIIHSARNAPYPLQGRIMRAEEQIVDWRISQGLGIENEKNGTTRNV